MKTFASISAALLTVLSFSATAESTIQMVNNSGWELHEIYFSPASQDEWGDDYLGDEVLEQGDSLTISGVNDGKWDIRLVDEDGDECTLEDVHITESESWEITEDDLLGCQAATE